MKFLKTFESYSDESEKMLIVRYASHIHDDIKRNWSSWNFGLDGFEGTYEELLEAMDEATESSPLSISALEFYPDDMGKLKKSVGELYPNYWVVKDETRGTGLSCHVLPEHIQTVEDALKEVESKRWYYDGTGDGETVDCLESKVIYSEKPYGEFGMHILEIPM